MLSSLFITQLILLFGTRAVLRLEGLPLSLSVLISFMIIVVTLQLPMLPAGASAHEVSTPFTEPTNTLRSPEDKLTLWQFMTVSWMQSLIVRGKKSQLDDADVWKLGYEFQHRVLRDNFQELRGSVVRRLLAANGLDLIITSTLGILELVASELHPCDSFEARVLTTCRLCGTGPSATAPSCNGRSLEPESNRCDICISISFGASIRCTVFRLQSLVL